MPSSIRVSPSAGEFRDVELSLTYVIPFTVHNVSNKTKRIRFIPPRSGPFRLNRVAQSVAPGLTQVVEVEFSTSEELDYHDQWSLVTDDSQITIPLHAWFPCPNIQFPGFLSLGTTLAQHNTSKVLSMSNLGKRLGRFKFNYDQTLGLSITPKQGALQPSEKADIRVDYFGQEKGSFETLVDVDIEGQNSKKLHVTCKVVESRVELCDPEAGGAVSNLHFGTCYFGQVTTKTVKLTNQSPFVISFNVSSPDIAEGNGSEEEDGEDLVPISCSPAEGRLPAHGTKTLKFTFAPIQREKRKGFARTAKKAAELSEIWKNTFVVDILETEQKLELGIQAKAVQPDITFSETVFRFGECSVNDNRDILFTISNNSEELPINYSINRVAHFHAVPNSGKLQPKQESSIVVTFQPNQLGKFSNSLTCMLSDIKNMPLLVEGYSKGVETRRQLTGGIEKVGTDFRSKNKFIASQGALPGTMPAAGYMGTAADGTALVPKRPPPKGGSMFDEESNEDFGVENTLYLTEYEQKREHNRLYNQYIDNMKASRHLIQRLRSGEGFDLKAVDLGMCPAEGLKSPEPRVPRIEEPLWLNGGDDSGSDQKGTQVRQRRRLKFDENKIVKKKFKAQPTSLNEQRECKMVLSPKEIAEVVIGPKILDFGKVTVGSKNTKSFFVSNNLKTNIYLQVPLNIRDELKESYPSAQVVPPGATAGFDIVFQSNSVQTFQQAIYFTLNDHHKLKFVVFAEVVQMEVMLNPEEMQFRFGEFVLDSTLTQPLALSNNGNAQAAFSWEIEAVGGNEQAVSTFSVDPMNSFIPANGTTSVNVTYAPGNTNEGTAALVLRVENGPTKRVICRGSVPEAKCHFLEKKVDCGQLPVGCVKNRVVSIKNTGAHTAVFNIEDLIPGITCDPTRGRVVAGSTQELVISFRPTASNVYYTHLVCNIRGGKSHKLLLRAEASTPLVKWVKHEIEEPITFEESFVGAMSYVPLWLGNEGNTIPAILTLDLREYPDFYLADADQVIVDRIAEEEDLTGLNGMLIIKTETDESSIGSGEDSDFDENEFANGSRDTPRGPSGRLYRIQIPPDEVLNFNLAFKPTVVEAYNFPLHLTLAGTDPHDMELSRTVYAKALKPRLVLSQTVVDFQAKVVMREGTSKVPNRVLLKLSNEDDKPLEWEMKIPSDSDYVEIFRIEPSAGKLQPGQAAQVQVTFSPLEVRPYEIKVPVYLAGNKGKYSELVVRGLGSLPSIGFDRQEVNLPVVPLDVPSKLSFNLNNDGYESLEVKYRLPFHESNRIPLTLTFPEGNRLSQAHPSIVCEVTLQSKKPISFTAYLDFLDDDGNQFSIPVTGCTDNCLLTTYSYLYNRPPGAFSFEAEDNKKPVMFIEKDIENESQTEDPRSDTPRSRAFSIAGSVATEDSGPGAAHDRALRKVYSKKHSDRLRNWLNTNVLQEPIDDFIGGLSANNGRILYDIFDSLFGRAPPGRVNPDRLSANKKDAAQQVVKQFGEVILFVKTYGGLLSSVRPEFLLNYETYCRLEPEAAGARKSSTGPSPRSASIGGIGGGKKRLSERRFTYKALYAWMTLIFQMIRIFTLSKISWKAFITSALSEPLKKAFAAEGWANMKLDPSAQGSNIYTQGESLLLKWLNIHKNAYYSVESDKSSQGTEGSKKAGKRAELRITSFGQQLHDGRAFAAVLEAYNPPLARRFDSHNEGGFNLNPVGAEECEHNLTIVLFAMKEIGISTPYSAREIMEFDQRDMLLFVLNLYLGLGQFIPRTTVKFRGHLHQEIVKTIELKNPTKYDIEYDVSLYGSEEFILQSNHVTIEPQSSAMFQVTVKPRFKSPDKARLTFLSHGRGPLSASTVFNLETDATYGDPSSMQELETTLYEPVNHEFTVTNPFPTNGHFTVTLHQERLPSEDKYAEEASAGNFPDAFWTANDMVNIKKSDEHKMHLQFLPFIRGNYKCTLVFLDEKVGEFAVQFLAKALATSPSDKIVVQIEANTQAFREIPIPVRNSFLERGLNYVSERFKQFKSRDKRQMHGAGVEEDVMKYSINYGSPFWTGPKELELGKEKKPEEEDGKEKAKAKAMVKEQVYINVVFNPKGPGQYPSKIVLTSPHDVRVIEVEGKCRSPGMHAELEFNCPARQQITQDIPITNKSDKDWVISSALQGDYFSAPREIRVAAGRTKSYPLVFSPAWITDVRGQLTLKNNDTLEKYVYTLRGVGEPPLAETHLNVECRAREVLDLKVSIPNISHDDVTYKVESDMSFLSGDATLFVPRNETIDYEFQLAPTLGGKYTGSITFTDGSEHYLWYVVTVNVTRPPMEGHVSISAEMRKAMVAEIAIGNPTNLDVVFEVRAKGDGLLGDQEMALEPNQTRNYELIFAPLAAGTWEGTLSFYNVEVGEYWYKLSLKATEPEPTVLPVIQCDLGKSSSIQVSVQNPLDQELILSVTNTNETNFLVHPYPIHLKPFGEARPTITYNASALETPQQGTIIFSNNKVGRWVYEVEGYGNRPSAMEQVTISAPVGRSGTGSVMFRNPFPSLTKFVIKMKGDGHDAPEFVLMQKRSTHSIPAFGLLQIPITYKPQLIAEHQATVVVQLLGGEDDQMAWEYPLLGIAEATSAKIPLKFQTKSRKDVTYVIAVPLDQLEKDIAEETFTHDVIVPQGTPYLGAVQKAISVEPATIEDYIAYQKIIDVHGLHPIDPSMAQNHLFFTVGFVPLRPFTATVELCIRKATGGMWKFDMQVEALPPDPDDTIYIEAPLAKTESVSFTLTNIFPTNDAFTATFTSDTPAEFTVMPTKGTLTGKAIAPRFKSIAPTGSQDGPIGTQFVVSYTSTDYGKAVIGILSIDTEEMQWRYEVHGSLPKYQAPTGTTKVDRHLSGQTKDRLKEVKAARQRRNFMKENQAFVEQASINVQNEKRKIATNPAIFQSTAATVAPGTRGQTESRVPGGLTGYQSTKNYEY